MATIFEPTTPTLPLSPTSLYPNVMKPFSLMKQFSLLKHSEQKCQLLNDAWNLCVKTAEPVTTTNSTTKCHLMPENAALETNSIYLFAVDISTNKGNKKLYKNKTLFGCYFLGNSRELESTNQFRFAALIETSDRGTKLPLDSLFASNNNSASASIHSKNATLREQLAHMHKSVTALSNTVLVQKLFDRVIQRCIQEGNDVVLEKPFAVADIPLLIRELLPRYGCYNVATRSSKWQKLGLQFGSIYINNSCTSSSVKPTPPCVSLRTKEEEISNTATQASPSAPQTKKKTKVVIKPKKVQPTVKAPRKIRQLVNHHSTRNVTSSNFTCAIPLTTSKATSFFLPLFKLALGPLANSNDIKALLRQLLAARALQCLLSFKTKDNLVGDENDKPLLTKSAASSAATPLETTDNATTMTGVDAVSSEVEGTLTQNTL